MNKEELCNKIMESVSKEVKSALNEKAGVIEFDNYAYRNKISNIAKDLKNTNICFSDHLLYGPLNKINFKKFSYDFSGIISWLKQLDIYYAKDPDYFDAGALTTDNAIEDGLFVKKDGNIQLGTIYIIDNGHENILHVLFHEMCHLYDNSLFKEIWMNDEEYFFANRDKYDINKYGLNSDVSQFSLDDIHNVITESVYYSNFTESHAFMENTNFEIFEHLNKYRKEFYFYKDIEKMFL